MTTFTRIVLLALFAVLFVVPHASASQWQDERYHLSMDTPVDWVPMSSALLAQTNAQVSHVTGRGFIAGYALNETDVLVFPYILVQFKPYHALHLAQGVAAKPDERGMLEVLYAMVGAFRQRGPLPQTIDAPQFIDQFGNDHARLIRLEADGRFDFAGKIPHEVGQEPIRYHTHGLFGKDGVALVTVFTVEGYSGLTYVIQNDMRTLAFAEGFGLAALTDELPTPVAATDTLPGQGEAAASDQSTAVQPAPRDEAQAGVADPDQAAASADVAVNPADTTALVLILSLLGAALFIATLVVWFITHQKAQARRERNRARRERMLASQSTTRVDHQPRPAQPAAPAAPPRKPVKHE